MELGTLRDVYTHSGPFATVYLEARPPAEDSATQLRLRWADLREQLASTGADAAALEALDARLGEARGGEGQADGRVLVASAEGVALEADWDASLGAGDAAHWTVVPELGAYVRETARAVRALVVLADRQQAALRYEIITPERHVRELASQQTEGDAVSGVHKPRGGALGHKQMQRRAEEAISQNAGEIAEALRKAAAEFRPRVIVLAGEVQGRTAVAGELTDELAKLLTSIDRGGGERPITDDELSRELARIAERVGSDYAAHYAEVLGDGLPHGQAATGGEKLAEAAEFGAVDTLLFEDTAPAAREAFLIKTCAETDASFELLPAGTGIADGAGALLRFPLPEPG